MIETWKDIPGYDDEKSIERIIRKIELENPSMHKASDVEFEW